MSDSPAITIDPKAKQQIHLFEDDEGFLFEWTMDDVMASGTPIDDNSGNDMKYLGIKAQKTEKLHLEIFIEGGCLTDVVKLSGPEGVDFEYTLTDYDNISTDEEANGQEEETKDHPST